LFLCNLTVNRIWKTLRVGFSKHETAKKQKRKLLYSGGEESGVSYEFLEVFGGKGD